jgi:hypothetical protein
MSIGHVELGFLTVFHRLRRWFGLILTMLGTFVCISSATPAPQSGWTRSSFPGEKTRTVQGCVGEGSDYVCVFVRCDEAGRFSLHFSAPGPDIDGHIKLVVDGTDEIGTFAENRRGWTEARIQSNLFVELQNSYRIGRAEMCIAIYILGGFLARFPDR